jgi:hypothetical protein
VAYYINASPIVVIHTERCVLDGKGGLDINGVEWSGKIESYGGVKEIRRWYNNLP